MATILLVDRQKVFLEAFADVLERQTGLQVVGRETEMGGVMSLLHDVSPTLIVFEPGFSGTSLVNEVQQFRSASPGSRLIALVHECQDWLLEQIDQAPLHGLLFKNQSIRTLMNQLLEVMNGSLVIAPELDSRVTANERGHLVLTSRTRLSEMTPLQLQILRLLAMGLSVKETARSLNRSIKSIDSHKFRLMRILNIHDRVHLAEFARDTGILGETMAKECA